MAYFSSEAVEVPTSNEPNPDIPKNSYLLSLSTVDDYNEDAHISTDDSNYRARTTTMVIAVVKVSEEILVCNHIIQNQMPEEQQMLACELQNKSKKQCTPGEWKRNQRKQKHNMGLAYISSRKKDYVNKCKEAGKPFGNYTMFSGIFKNNFSILFFTSKKDQCETCERFKNPKEDERQTLLEKYEDHVSEKE
ncbi:hypothetical protein ILUMI_09529 [Ignelater luminosus]|uniref:Uncharacterized protein n=1 Tax=Ignelater luminosus TaxID=2038154 RepID=A0A8K0D422_IGNLU|nr:hypothetical protein ILUMI_09529 [Ignelater luminosus]